MLYVHPGELSGDEARWVTGLDRRYLNLWERWRVGFRTRGTKADFLSLVAEYGGCSAEEFLWSIEDAVGVRPVWARRPVSRRTKGPSQPIRRAFPAVDVGA